jgi:hypothetical protein
MSALLKKGDRIRLNVATVTGWRGKGTVLFDSYGRDSLVSFHGDGTPQNSVSTAVRFQVSRLRDQSQ